LRKVLAEHARAPKGYFPISLVKTHELPPDRKYVFGYHPHGIIGMGAIANFGTEGTIDSAYTKSRSIY
jgi:hypothetical protein